MSTNIHASPAGLKIISRPLAELKPDPANPRRHSKKQIRQIAKSIKEFGFNVPVLVDAELKVIAGHGRVLACRELDIDEVATVCLEHLTPAQARAFTIADNKLAENATWDDRLLAELLQDLSLSGPDFDIEVTGFEMGEIDLRIASLEDPSARCGEEGNLLALHPTVKPVAMVADAILDCLARGEIVLDAFLGSGMTVIAAERTGRRCRGIELDPAYIDTTIRRWQALTGGSACHAASGRRFDDLAREAEATNAL